MASLHYISPFFIVKNLTKSVGFYVENLGFEVRYIGPEGNPFFAIVGRDQISIMVKEITVDVQPTANHTQHEWARWDAYIYAEKPDDLFEEYYSKGVAFHQSIQNTDDGLRGFEVMDADGYVLFFGKPLG